MNQPFSKAFKASLVTHSAVIILLLIGPLISRCTRPKPDENVIFVEMVAPAPPAPPAPVAPTPPPVKPPEPEVKPPEPEKIPEPPKIVEQPKKKTIERSTNIVVRPKTTPPAPPPKPISAEELAKTLMSNLPQSSSPTHSSANVSELSRYYGTIQGILYQAWQQPPGVAGLSTRVSIRIAKNGAIMERKQLSGSGSANMDDSVMRALKSVSSLPRLPDTINKSFIDVTITFASEGVTM